MPSHDPRLTLLTAVFIASLVTANLLGSKLIVLFGVTVSVGIFVFPFTFMTADIITELFGKEQADTVVKAGIAVQLYVLLFVYLGGLFPAAPALPLGDAYERMFALAPRMVIASVVAYSVSQLLDVRVFAYLKQRFDRRYLLVRTNIAAWISQLVDTSIFMAIFLGGVLSWTEWWKSFAAAYLCKMIVATCDSPVVNLGVALLKRWRPNVQ